MTARSFISRFAGALVLLVLCCAGHAAASPITVNKQFAPSTVTLGNSSTVTVTLQNNDPTNNATITGFSDDVGTMNGGGLVNSAFGVTTTCTSGTPTILGNVVSMNNGVVPMATGGVPGSCTITFQVFGNKAGNSVNTIFAANVNTSLGAPPGDVSQTLNVQAQNITVSAGPTPQVVAAGATPPTNPATLTFTLTNPAVGIPLTNVAFPVNVSTTGGYFYTATSATTSCGGSGALPAANSTNANVTFTGLTIPANGSCTVTIVVTGTATTASAPETVNLQLSATAVTSDQNITNSGSAATQAKFVVGNPNITKSFAPNAIQPNGTSTLTIRIANVLSSQTLDSSGLTDTLPAGLVVAPVPNASTTCAGGTVTAAAGTGTVALSGATIPAGGAPASTSCTITVSVTSATASSYTNTIPATGVGSFTSTEVNGSTGPASATLVVTGPGGAISIGKSVNPSSVGPNTPVTFTLTFNSIANGAFTGGSFTDTLPQTPQPMAVVSANASQCGGTIATTATAVSGSSLIIPAGGSCTVTFTAQFTTITNGTSITDTNTLPAAGVTFFVGATSYQPAANATATITELPVITLTNFVNNNGKALNFQPATVSAQIVDSSATPDTNLTATFNLLPGQLKLAPSPNYTFTGCPAGVNASSITPGSNGESFTVFVPSISATCTIGYDVINEVAVTSSTTYQPGNSSYTSALTGCAVGPPPACPSSQLFPHTNGATFSQSNINITKAFVPNQIQAGSTSVASITISVAGIPGYANTQANGVVVPDTLPANVFFAPTPNVTFSPGCQQTGQPAPSSAIVGSTITASTISLLTVGTTPTTCTIGFTVTSSVIGTPLNTIGAGAITSTSGITNSQSVSASLTVAAGVAVQKTYIASNLPLGGSTFIRFLLTNSTATSVLTGGTLTDNMPAQLVLASTTLGPLQGGDPAQCGGAITGAVNSSNFQLTGLTIPALVGTTPGQCVVYVKVTTSAGATAGPVTNTIASGGLLIGGYSNQTPSSATNTLIPAINVPVSKAFAPAGIPPNGTSVLTISVVNNSAGNVPLSGMALSDTLPAGVTIATPPSASTTCGPGSVAAAAGGTTVGLTGGSVAAGATCTVSVSVTSSAVGSYSNTIPVSALTTNQGATNSSPAQATLAVLNPNGVTVTKGFAPAQIAAGGTSTLTIGLANTSGSALNALSISDALPANVTVAPVPNASTTCTGGTVTASAGSSSVTLAGGSLALNASCTVTVSVTGTLVGAYTNTIPAGAVSTAQLFTNTAPAQAALTIAAGGVVVAKSFAPATITSGATSALTISVANTTAVALSSVALSDALPANITIAATPNAATTCVGGSVSAVSGGSTVGLGGANLAANATCTITLSVTGTLVGTYTNTIPAGAVTTAQGTTNPAPAQAVLNISAPVISIAKSFSPVAILASGTSTLTVTVNNTSLAAIPLSSVALTDALPANVTIAPAPNPGTTCAGATVTAVAGGTTVALSGASLPALASCTFSVSVTSATVGTYVNTIPAGALSDTQGLTNQAPAQAMLLVSNGSTVGISKTFSPPAIPVNGTSTETITLTNTSSNAIGLTGMTLIDTLPPGVTIASTPGAGTTCGSGTVTAVAGGSTTTLRGGSLAAGATCTITVVVTSGTAGVYLNNTIPADSLTTNQGSTNMNQATAAINVGGTSAVALTKSFTPAVIAPGAASTLTISFANTALSAVPLTAVALTDALPANITVAATPNAATTCTGGTVTALPGAATVALSGASIAPNATCTVTVLVTGTLSGVYVNTIPANAITSTQIATNPAPAQATLTIGPSLVVTKTSNPMNANVSPGETITYSVVVKNVGSIPETNATITDALTNATLVAGSVTVNGVAAPDTVVTAAKPFGTIAAGTSTTIAYSAVVNLNAAAGATVTNNATGGGDQPCAAASCAASSGANTVLAPALTVSKLLDGQQSESVVPGQTVTYGITIVNTAAVPAYNTTVTDAIPAGYSAVAGSVTLNGAPLPAATLNGQTLVIPVGQVPAGGTVLATFKAVITPAASSAGNIVSTIASGIASPVMSNSASARVVPPTIAVTKSTTASTVTSGDRVDYSITAASTNNVAYGATTIADSLPNYEIYAPGTARVNGRALEPVVQGHTLTWTLPSLASLVTITYSTVIAPGAPQNGTLTNTVNVSAIAAGGTGRGQGSASASVLVVGSTFGSCYPITGRVYLDAKGSGRFEDPDVGLAHVHVYLDNGESVTTDSTGRYDFPCVHPGMHALRLDETTLPSGVKAYDDRNIDSEKSTRRLIHRVYDDTIIEDVNFAVTGTPVKQ